MRNAVGKPKGRIVSEYRDSELRVRMSITKDGYRVEKWYRDLVVPVRFNAFTAEEAERLYKRFLASLEYEN